MQSTNNLRASKKMPKEPFTIYVDPKLKQAYLTYSVLEKYPLDELLRRSFLHYKKHKADQLARNTSF